VRFDPIDFSSGLKKLYIVETSLKLSIFYNRRITNHDSISEEMKSKCGKTFEYPKVSNYKDTMEDEDKDFFFFI